jgi:hypothetical protein
MKKLVLSLMMATSMVASAQSFPTNRNTNQSTCDGFFLGPGSQIGMFGGTLGPDWAVITGLGDKSGFDGCFIKLDTLVWNQIRSECSIGKRCTVTGEVSIERNSGNSSSLTPRFHKEIISVSTINGKVKEFDQKDLPADW